MDFAEKIKDAFLYKDGNLYRKKKIGNQQEGLLVGWDHVSNGKTYKRMSFDYKFYYVHQIVFLYHYGYMPKCVDHIDRDTKNNRIENLREVTHQENCQNKLKHKNNTSGYKGVTFNKQSNNWTASIWKNYKRKFLGNYPTPEQAYEAYLKAAKELHTHNPFMTQEHNKRAEMRLT